MATPGTQAQTNEVLREAQAAHATNNLLQGIINGASDLIAALDLNFRFIAFNQPYAGEFAKIFGTAPAEGMHFLEVLAHLPDDQADTREAWERALRGEEFSTTLVFGDSNGKRNQYEVTFRTLRNTGGQPIGATHFMRRISPHPRAGIERDYGSNSALPEQIAAEHLRRGLAELQAIYATAPVGLCFVDTDLRFVNVNQAMAEMNHLPVDDHIGRTLHEVVPTVADTIAAYCRRVIRTGKPVVNVEIYGISTRVPGLERYCLANYCPVQDEDGTVLGVNVVVQDITARKRAEEALRRSEERYRLAARATNEAIWDWDLRTDRVEWNLAIASTFGYAEALQGTDAAWWKDRIHPRDRERVLDSVQAIIDGESERWSEEYRFLHADGAYTEVLDCGFMVRDGQGRPIRMIGAMLDITERKRVEAALRASEARYRHLANALPQIVWICNAQGRLEYLNQRWTQYTGMLLEESLGAGALQAIHPDDHDRIITTWKQALLAGTAYEVELRLRRADGLYRWHLARSMPIQDAGANVVKWFGSATDMHDQRAAVVALQEAKEAAEAANRMKSTFLANMSHEIRTPLTSMIGFASLLARKLEGKYRTQAQRIEQSGKRLLETLNAVLMLAKLEADRVEVKLEAIPVATEVREVARLYHQQAEEKGLALRVKVMPHAATARACLDRGALTSILQNLVANAIKFTEQGCVTVTVDADDVADHAEAAETPMPSQGCVHVHVEDTGIGIAPAFFPHLFDAFRQESTDASHSYGGSGLGLAITKQLVEKMQGSITVQSAKGCGSRFTISFPIADNETTQPDRAHPPEDLPNRRRCHFLLVEDDPDTQTLIVDLLPDQCALTVAVNAEEAITAAQRVLNTTGRPFDAVLMDINLGGGPSGTDVLNMLRAIPAYRTVPIAALTAYALPGDRERFLLFGFDAYLRKPFTAEELLDLMTQLLP